MPDTTTGHFAVALASLGARFGSLTSLTRELRLPEATVRRWARGLALPPPERWIELRAALEREGLGHDVPELECALAADIGEAYRMGVAERAMWQPYIVEDVMTALRSDDVETVRAAARAALEARDAGWRDTEALLLQEQTRADVLEQTSGELCDVCGARACWPTRDGELACRLCADGGAA